MTQRVRVIVAFAAIYIIWGSTYLAIRFAIETLPGFLMAGVRFLIAGIALYAWARWRGAARPTRVNWRAAAIVGGLMLLGGNGGVVWAEQRVPSGLTAVLIATVPLWVALLDWLQRGTRPSGKVLAGLGLGLAGILLLVKPGELAGSQGIDLVGAGVLVVGALSWAAGSLYSRRAALPSAPLLATAMEMLSGGALLLLAGLVTGQGAQLNLAHVSARSVLSVGYLIVFGSLVAFTAYVWLLRVVSPARAATYAYVNPVVAVLLGWALAGEPLTPRTLIAAAIIVGAVVLITAQPRRERVRMPAREPIPVLAGGGRPTPGPDGDGDQVATLADCEEAGGVPPC